MGWIRKVLIDKWLYMHPFFFAYTASWCKLPIMSCMDYNSIFLTAIFALCLPSILLPELTGSIKHIVSDIGPKWPLKGPHTCRLKSKFLLWHSWHTRLQDSLPDSYTTSAPHTLGTNHLEPVPVLDHVLYLPLCLCRSHSVIFPGNPLRSSRASAEVPPPLRASPWPLFNSRINM